MIRSTSSKKRAASRSRKRPTGEHTPPAKTTPKENRIDPLIEVLGPVYETLLEEPIKRPTGFSHLTEKAAVKRLIRDEKLKKELLRIGVKLGNLARVVTYYSHLRAKLRESRTELARAQDNKRKKIKRAEQAQNDQPKEETCRGRKPSLKDKEGRRRAFVKTELRMQFAEAPIGVGKEYEGETIPYFYHRFLSDLRLIFEDRSKRKYRHIAATLTLFDLHPHPLCTDCSSFKNGECKNQKPSVLDCHRRERARQRVFSYLKRHPQEPSYVFRKKLK